MAGMPAGARAVSLGTAPASTRLETGRIGTGDGRKAEARSGAGPVGEGQEAEVGRGDNNDVRREGGLSVDHV